MSSMYPEVRQLVGVLVDKVKSCEEPLNAQNFGDAVYGLQSMRSEYPEVRQLVEVLVDKVKSCEEPLGEQALGNALYGHRARVASTQRYAN